MGRGSRIEWTDHTFNPWIGCTAVSPACAHCYAEAAVTRYGQDFSVRRRTSPANWRAPLKWNREAEASGIRRKVFCASWADVFDNQVPEEWRADLWDLISMTRSLDWLLLTKRPQNIMTMLPSHPFYQPWPWPHVWLGTTAETQPEAARRIRHLMKVRAAKRFLSCEPLLALIDLTDVDSKGDYVMDCLRPSSHRELWELDWSPEATGMPLEKCIADFTDEIGPYPPSDTRPTGIDWVICGGESGPDARPTHPEWVRSLRDQCIGAGVPFFFKQWGEWAPVSDLTEDIIDGCYHPAPARCPERTRRPKVEICVLHASGKRFDRHAATENGAFLQGTGAMTMMRVGKKTAGATLNGREWREMPGDRAVPGSNDVPAIGDPDSGR